MNESRPSSSEILERGLVTLTSSRWSAARRGTVLGVLLFAASCGSDKNDVAPQDGGTPPPEDTGVAPPPDLLKARSFIYDNTDRRLGTATFTELQGGAIVVTVAVSGFADGDHGVHLHLNGVCEKPSFASAGDHWNPTMMNHGAPQSAPHHAGDLGNLTVSGGTGSLTLTTSEFNLKPGDPLSAIGHAIIVHANPDDFVTQTPPGNAGPRLGCGIVEIDDGSPPRPPPPLDGGVVDVPDTGPRPDAVPPNANVTVAGKLVELGAYLAQAGTATPDGGAAPIIGVGGVSISTVGLSPEQQTSTSEVNAQLGDYTLTLPQNGKVVLFGNKLGYFPSYNEVATQANNIADKRIYIASTTYINEIATAHNVNLATPFACHGPPQGGLNPSEQCVYGIIVGRILDDGTAGNGTVRPVAGVSAANFEIVGGPNNDVWYKKGPYFLDYTGTSSATATASIVSQDAVSGQYRGGLFVTFVEIPQISGGPGLDFRITIRYPSGPITRYFGPTSIKAFRPYGVSWTSVLESGAPPPPVFTNIDFDSQVYPIFLPIAQGGFGCQGCHSGPTPAAGMDLSGPPENAYRALDPTVAGTARVNLAAPPQSLLLTKPLYEPTGPQNHPIFAFTNEQDPAYRTILTWIQEGAQREVVVRPVSFATDVRPILAYTSTAGGAGCVVCHGVRPEPGNFYVGGPAIDLYNELTQETPADNGLTGEPYRIHKTPGEADKSLVLLNPLLGSPEPHPVKLFSSNQDPRYVTIYRWITEGYQNN